MTHKDDHMLANIQRKELALSKIRKDILNQDSQTALDSLLGAPAPATLIQSFPDQDLYYLMHKIGVYDFIPVLALATSNQWEYILDLEVWDNDRIDFKNTSKALDILFQADPQRLMRWLIKEKPDFIENYYFRHMEIWIREHDDIPPEDHEDYITLDDKFYFRFPQHPKGLASDDESIPEPDELAPELIEKMMKTVASMDLSVFHALMLEINTVLSAEIEEEQFRLKNIRLAEKGFLASHEAVGIYQPCRFENIRHRPGSLQSHSKPVFDPDMPSPPQYHSQYITGNSLFERSLKLVEEPLKSDLESELAALINKVISADKIKIRENEDMESAICKTSAFLSLGIEVLVGTGVPCTPQGGAGVIEKYFLEDIFRSGSGESIALKSMVMKWHRNSFVFQKNLPLSFLGEKWLGILGGLFLDRPLFFDNYRRKKDLYRHFETLEDINETRTALKEIFATDDILVRLDVDPASFDFGVLTFKTLLLTLWAKNRLALDPTLEAIPKHLFKPFFKEMFLQKNHDIRQNDFIFWICEQSGLDEKELPPPFFDTVQQLFSELEEEYGQVSPDHIDPRFISHFLLKLE